MLLAAFTKNITTAANVTITSISDEIQKYIMDRDRNYKEPRVGEFIADHPEGVYIIVHQPLMGINTINLLINGDQISGDQKLIGPKAKAGPLGVVKGKEE